MLSAFSARAQIVDVFLLDDRVVHPSRRAGKVNKDMVAEHILDVLSLNGLLSSEHFGRRYGRSRRAISASSHQKAFNRCVYCIELAFSEFDDIRPGAFYMGLAGHTCFAIEVARRLSNAGYLSFFQRR